MPGPSCRYTKTNNLSSLSDNLTQTFVDLLPDIEKIYRDSLIMPFIKAEDKIYDEDIHDFYRELLGNSLLRDPDSPQK